MNKVMILMIRIYKENSALSFAFYQKTKDITLNFTASCQSAICGACAVRVNGYSYLACDTKM